MVNIRQLSDHIFLEIGIINKKKCKKGTPRRFWFCILNPSSIEKFCTGNVHGNLPLKVRKKCIHYEKEREGKKQGRRRTLFSFHFSMWWKKKPQCNVVSRYGAPWTEILQKCAIFMEFVLCIEFFLWIKWAPKRDLQSEEKFLDVDCLGFGNICF